MTINKSKCQSFFCPKIHWTLINLARTGLKCQSLNNMRLYLLKPRFCNRQLYVTLSKETLSKELRVPIAKMDKKYIYCTKNIV